MMTLFVRSRADVQEEGEEWEYASYREGSKVDGEEAHVEPALLAQSLNVGRGSQGRVLGGLVTGALKSTEACERSSAQSFAIVRAQR
jgi:hypothetical protein